MRVEPYEPPPGVMRAVERIAEVAGLDLSGVEYLVAYWDGRALFYDINALSNFVADAVNVVGFDPHGPLVDYLEREMQECAMANGYWSTAGWGRQRRGSGGERFKQEAARGAWKIAVRRRG